MKKILLLIVLFVSLVVAAAGDIAYEVNSAGLTKVPSDVVVLDLNTEGDAVEDSTYVVYGPYAVTPAKGYAQYSGYQFYSGTLGGTTPTAAFAYQLSWSSDTADIEAGNWVTTDTLAATGSTDYVDLSSKSGKFIYFRVHNYDATYDTLGVLKILLKK